MATYTTNYNLKKPDSSDPFGDFRSDYNDNLYIIDANLGGGGGSSTLAGLSDVSITTPSNGQVLTYDSNDSSWKNANPSGGSGGHTIEDADGTALTQRTNLQFAGYLNTTDDSVNDATVVDDTPTEVTWATWQTMSSAQKQGKHWVITNVPSGVNVDDTVLLNQALTFVGNSASISNGNVTADTLVEVFFKDASLTEATSCKVVVDTASGSINFSSTSNPQNTLYCDVVIRN